MHYIIECTLAREINLLRTKKRNIKAKGTDLKDILPPLLLEPMGEASVFPPVITSSFSF